MSKIIIVDDHPVFLIGLKTLLQQCEDLDVVATASDGDEAISKITMYKPDIVLLDVIMPGKSGIEVTEIVKQNMPETRILILSNDHNFNTIQTLMNKGIDGFVSKDAPSTELRDAIYSVLNGSGYYGTDISNIIERVHSSKNVDSTIFTPRELDVIRLSCEGLQYKEIAARLGNSTKTVDTLKTNIFRKLGINNTTELVIYAIKHGLITI